MARARPRAILKERQQRENYEHDKTRCVCMQKGAACAAQGALREKIPIAINRRNECPEKISPRSTRSQSANMKKISTPTIWMSIACLWFAGGTTISMAQANPAGDVER